MAREGGHCASAPTRNNHPGTAWDVLTKFHLIVRTSAAGAAAAAGPGAPKDGLTTAQFVLRNDYTAAALRQKEALAKQRGSDWFSASS